MPKKKKTSKKKAKPKKKKSEKIKIKKIELPKESELEEQVHDFSTSQVQVEEFSPVLSKVETTQQAPAEDLTEIAETSPTSTETKEDEEGYTEAAPTYEEEVYQEADYDTAAEAIQRTNDEWMVMAQPRVTTPIERVGVLRESKEREFEINPELQQARQQQGKARGRLEQDYVVKAGKARPGEEGALPFQQERKYKGRNM